MNRLPGRGDRASLPHHTPRPPRRESFPNLGPLRSADPHEARAIPTDAHYTEPGEGEPVISARVPAREWPAWTDRLAWTLDAEALDECDPPLPLFRRRAHQAGGN